MYHNLVNGRDPLGKFSRQKLMARIHFIFIFLFTSRTWQNSHVEAIHANYSYGKIKSRKKSLGKEKKKKNRPKDGRNISILPKKDLT